MKNFIRKTWPLLLVIVGSLAIYIVDIVVFVKTVVSTIGVKIQITTIDTLRLVFERINLVEYWQKILFVSILIFIILVVPIIEWKRVSKIKKHASLSTRRVLRTFLCIPIIGIFLELLPWENWTPKKNEEEIKLDV